MNTTAIAAAAVGLFLVGWVIGMFTHIDPSGLSFGTDSSYCYIELHHTSLDEGCEVAR